jgi:hypothetical protein
MANDKLIKRPITAEAVPVARPMTPIDPNKDAGWPPTWQLLADTIKLVQHLSFHHYSPLDSEPYSVSCSFNDGYVSFKGKTPTHALRKLVLMLKAQLAIRNASR